MRTRESPGEGESDRTRASPIADLSHCSCDARSILLVPFDSMTLGCDCFLRLPNREGFLLLPTHMTDWREHRQACPLSRTMIFVLTINGETPRSPEVPGGESRCATDGLHRRTDPSLPCGNRDLDWPQKGGEGVEPWRKLRVLAVCLSLRLGDWRTGPIQRFPRAGVPDFRRVSAPDT